VHTNCTILKLHGDYKDVRIKNTLDELEHYEPLTKSLLDRILDEYGLIVCGWSAEWDTALRNALYEKTNRRYQIYWTGLNEPQNTAKDLIDFLPASFIHIENADVFFTSVSDKVQAIESDNLIHPLTIKTAVAIQKKLLAKSENRIKLHDMLRSEINRMMAECQEIYKDSTRPEVGNILKRLKTYEKSSLISVHLFATGCYFDVNSMNSWHTFLADIANPLKKRNGSSYVVWDKLQLFPAMLIYYASCISCMLSMNYTNLFNLMYKVRIKNSSGEVLPAHCKLHPAFVFESIYRAGEYFNMKNRKTPANDYMFDTVKQFFDEIVMSEEKYCLAFDSFEYLNGLLYASSTFAIPKVDSDTSYSWGPVGCFYWRRPLGYPNETFYNNNEYIDYERLLETGFWDGNKKVLEAHKNCFDAMIKKFRHGVDLL
jgi:hypothetical protein